MRVVERCGEFVEAMRTAQLAPEVLHHAKRAVIDWVAAALPGAVVPPAIALEAALAEELDHGAARLVLGRPATVRAAALINGTAAHTVEVDDIFRDGIYHPGAPTIAAALALAQAGNLNGIAFLRAVIAGYEISTRIARAMGRAHYRFWHNTGTIGAFGAAAAGASALGLDRVRTAHALATVTTFAAGLQQAFRGDSMSKPLHAGRAAEAGVTAALAAREGVTGAFDVIDGQAGFGRAMGDGPDWDAAFATLGTDYNIARMTFKNHACCGHTFAAIDGALAARSALGATAEDVARVRIGSYRAATDVSGIEDPHTPAEARFSIKYVVAHALRHGSVRLAAFAPAPLADPATRALMCRIEVSIDPELDAAFPGQRAARVTLETRDGRSHALLQPARKGDPELPLDDRELEAKYLELAAPVIGDAPARSLLERLRRLERQPEVTLVPAPAAVAAARGPAAA
ncbi:MAG: MmgE/PrpD family protein [Burkholderiales bacterium]